MNSQRFSFGALLLALLILTGIVANFAFAAPLIPFTNTGKALALRAQMRTAAAAARNSLSRSSASPMQPRPLVPLAEPVVAQISPTGRNTANGRAVFRRDDFGPTLATTLNNKLRFKGKILRPVTSSATPIPGAVQTFDIFNPPPGFRPLLGYQNPDGTLGNNPQNPPVYATALSPTNLFPVWSQDETFVVFSSNRNAAGGLNTDASDGVSPRFHLWAISVNGGQAYQITTSTGPANGGELYPALISSNNSELAFTSDAQTPGIQNLYAIPFSLGNTVAGNIANISSPTVAVSPTNVAGTGFSQVQRPTISPSNSNLVVFSALSTAGTYAGHSHLYFLYLTTGGYDPNNNSLPAKLTDGPADDTDPAYSNDGQLIAFASTANGLATTGDAFSSDPNSSQSRSTVTNGTTVASNRSIFLLSGGTQAAFGTVPTMLQSTAGRETIAGTDDFGPAWSFTTTNQYTNPSPGYEYLAFSRGASQSSPHDIDYLQVVRAVNAGGESGKSNEGATTPEPASTPIYQITAGGFGASGGPGENYTSDEFFSGGTVGGVNPPVNQVNDPNTPPAVYNYDRTGNFTYTIPNLTPGANYTINLHFADPTNNQVNQREFNVAINGNQVLQNFDIVRAARSSPGELGGLVTDSNTGNPINGATIAVTGYDTGQPVTTVPATIHSTGAETTGPDNGNINYSASLSGSSPADAYVVTVTAANYGTESEVVYVPTSGFSRADFTLTSATMATRSTITGLVSDANLGTSATISSAIVTVGTLDSNNDLITYAISAPTGNNGRYTVHVPAGTYYVTVTPNNGSSSTYQVMTQQVTTTSGATATQNFALQSGPAVGIVGGLIKDATTNQAIAGATVIVRNGVGIVAIAQSSGSVIAPVAPIGNGGAVNYGTLPSTPPTVQELYVPTGAYQVLFNAAGYQPGPTDTPTVVNTPASGNTPANEYAEADASLTNANPGSTGQNTAVVETFSGIQASMDFNNPIKAGQITIQFYGGAAGAPIVQGIEVISDSSAPTSSGFGHTSGQSANQAPPDVYAIGGDGTATVYFDQPATGASAPSYYNIYRAASANPTTTNNPDTGQGSASGTEGAVPYVTQATVVDTGTQDFNNGDEIFSFTDPNVTDATEYYYQVTAVYNESVVQENNATNAAIKLITENNPPDNTNAYDDRYPSWSPFHSIFSIIYSSNRTVTYNVPSPGNASVSIPSEIAQSIPQNSAVAGAAGVPGYTVAPNYTGILESQVLNLDPPILLRFSSTETVHVQQGNAADPVNGTPTKIGIVPGQSVTFTVRVSNRESGVKNVYIQIKDPDSKYQDVKHEEHKIFAKDPEFNGQANQNSVEGIPSGSANQFPNGGELSIDDGYYLLGGVFGRGALGGQYGNSPATLIGKTGGGNNPYSLTNYNVSPPSVTPFTGDDPNLFIPWGPEYECQFVNANFATSGNPNAPLDTSPADYGTPYYLAGVDDQQAYSVLDATNSTTTMRYPNGNSHPAETEWLPLTLIPSNQQDNKGGLLYTATWTTPTSASDYYLDVIAYDNAVFPNFPANTSPYSNHSGNFRIYDNVGGFSTLSSIGNNDILVISDYALGQKFAGTTFAGSNGNLNLVPKLYGAESYVTDVDNNVLPDTLYQSYPTVEISGPTFLDFEPLLNSYTDNLPYLNGLGVGSYSDGVTQEQGAIVDGVAADKSQQYSIWRVLSRGPIPQTVLNAYLPTKQTQPAVADLQGPAQYQNVPAATVLDAHRCVIWVSPYTGDLLTDPGALDDPGSFNIPNQPDRQSTQTILRNFVQAGGRLFISGQDVGSGLTLGGTVGNSAGGFLSDVLNATLASSNGGSTTIVATSNRIAGDPGYDGQVGGNYPGITGSYATGFFIVNEYPYQNNLILGSYSQSDGSLDQRATLDLPNGADLLGQIDSIVPQNGAITAMTYNTANGPVAMVYHDDPYSATGTGTLPNGGTGSRVVYGGFGIEGLSADVYSPAAPTGISYPPIAPRNPRQNLLHNIVCFLRTGSISGNVTQTAGTGVGAGQGVPGVTVYLVPRSGIAPPTRATFSAATSADGKYTIVGVEPGVYTIAAYKAGYSRAVSNAGVSFTVEGDVNVNGAALTVTPLPPGNIAGSVTDTSNNPIPDATVAFTSRDQTVTVRGTTFGGANPATPTNPSGTYFLPNVPVTEYDTAVAVSPDNPNGKPEYYSAPHPINAPFYDPTNGTIVTVQANTTTEPVNFVLAPILASISGHIFDTTIGDTAAGSLVGATVTLTNTATGAVVGTTTTDASGNYSFTNIPSAAAATAYAITAADTNYASNSVAVTVYYGDMLTAQDVGLTPLPVVSGQVTDATTHTGIAGATVTFKPSTGAPVSFTADANGNYTSVGLQPGTYAVTASSAGYITSAPVTLTLTAGQRVTQPFALQPIPPGTISGTVADPSGRPIAGAAVTFVSTDKTITLNATTDANGNYSIASAPATTYTGNAAGPPNPNGKPEYSAAAPQPPYATSVTVTQGNNTGPVAFVLAPIPPTISGTVTNATTHAGIPGATVTFTPSGGGAAVVVTADAHGNYTSGSLTPGTYTIVASALNYNPSNPMTLTVHLGDALTQNLQLTAIPPGSISGTVTDSSGNPIVGATVTFTSATGEPTVTATTGAGGTYSLPSVPANTYTGVASDSPQYANSAAQTVVVPSGGNVAATFTLAPVPPMATGTVTDTSTGKGIPGATVTFTPASGAPTVFTTDANGNYNSGSSLSPGTYTVVATAPGYYPSTHSGPAVTLTLTLGQTVTQNFPLSQMATIGGLVTDASGAPLANASITVKDSASGTVITTNPSPPLTSATTSAAPDGSGPINYLATLPPGTYTVTASAASFSPVTSAIKVVTNAPFTRFDFKLTSTIGTLGGLVTDSTTTNPVGGATVTVADATTKTVITTFITNANTSLAPDGNPINYSGSVTQGTYIVTVTKGNRTSAPQTVTIVGGAFTRLDFTGSIGGLPPLHTFPAGLNFLSTPYDYTGSTFDSIFGALNTAAAGTTPNGNRSHVAVWNPLIGQYALDPTPPADALRLGVGYWVYLKNPVPLNQQGASPTGATVSVGLHPAWNQIGVPNTSAISVSSLTFANGTGGTLTFTQATSSAYHLVSPTLYSYNAATGNYQAIGPSGTLQPWQAYWIMVYADATLLLPTGQ